MSRIKNAMHDEICDRADAEALRENGYSEADIDAMRDTRLSASSGMEEIVGALEPFASEARQFDGTNYSDHEAAFAFVSNITVGDLRRARAALARIRGSAA